MINLIIVKELREILGSKKFVLSFGVCSVLIVLAFYLGAQNHQLFLARYDAAKTENDRKLEGLTDWMMVNNYRVFLPPQPLESLVMGISNDIGRTINVYARGELTAIDSRFNDDPLFAVFSFLDLHFIFLIIIPLFAILLTYDAINGEKERGTLRLSFANAIPRATYIIAKIMGAFLALVIPLLIPMLIGCLLLIFIGISLTIDEWVRLVGVILTGIMYFGAFLTLSVFISSSTRRSAHSFLLMLIIWIFSVFIIPRAAVLLAGRAVTVPSVDQLAYQKGTYSAQLMKEDRQQIAKFQPTKSDNPQSMAEEFQKFMQELSNAREQKMDAFTSRLNEELYNKQRQQELLAFSLARSSPSAIFSFVTTTLVGTSIDLKQHFLANALTYQQQYRQFMKQKTGIIPDRNTMMLRVNSAGATDEQKTIDPHELPRFDYQNVSLAAVLNESLIDFALLLLLNILFFAGAFVKFLSYDVR